VRSLIAGDRCTSLAYVRSPLGDDSLAIAFFMAGTVQVYRLHANGAVDRPARLPEFDAVDYHRQIVSLHVASLLPGRSFLVLGMRQGQQLAPFEIVNGGLTAWPRVALPLRLGRAAPGPGDGGGIVVSLAPAGQPIWVWWTDQAAAPKWLPLVPASGVAHLSSLDGLLAMSLPTADSVRLFAVP
jgi:hypothetical protein